MAAQLSASKKQWSWEWHSTDHVSTSESHAPVPTNTTPWDAFHVNSIEREPNGDLLWYKDTHRDGTPVTPDGLSRSSRWARETSSTCLIAYNNVGRAF